MAQRIHIRMVLAAGLMVVTGLAACDQRQVSFSELDEVQRANYVYSCADGYRFSVRLLGDSAVVDLGERVLTLARADTAAGETYEAGDTVLQIEGGRARLDEGGVLHEDCEGIRADNPWEAARALGVTFRAVGQEPGWIVDINRQRQLRYTGDYGTTRIVFPAAEPVWDDSTNTVVFQSDTTGHQLVLTITPEPCQDAMSGETFTHTVAVQVDGNTLRGCGRGIPTGDLTGTYWKLVEMEGSPVVAGPGGREAHIRFDAEGSRVTGSTGCNQFGGTYDVAGDSLQFGQLVMTRMACLDGGVMEQEQAFERVLGEVNRYSVRDDSLTFFVTDHPVMRFGADYLR